MVGIPWPPGLGRRIYGWRGERERLHVGDPPDRFLAGLAALSLVADVAEEQPGISVADNAQWLNQASARALVL